MLTDSTSQQQLRLRKRSSAHGIVMPDTLYLCCMRIVTRNLATFDSDVLRMLPALIKTQMLRNVTRHGDALSRPCDSSVHLLQSLLHRELLQLDLRAASARLTALQLIEIVRDAPNLRELKLSGAILLSTDDLLDGLSRLPQLRALQTSGMASMDDAVIQMLAARCPGLEVLDVSRCERVGDGSAETVRGMRLKKLNVAHTAITDVFLRQMADSRFNEHLDEINLGGCAVTSDGLKHLRWDKLKYIGFEGANLTDMEFVKKLGNLKFIQWTIST